MDGAFRLQPSERKLLFVFVRKALLHPGDDSINPAKRNPNTVQALRALGYIATDEDKLTKEAFLAYFETTEELRCPPAVQRWVDRLGVTEIHWRRAPDAVRRRMAGQERGAAYPALATVFIGDDGDESTWLHELGHIVGPRIDQQSLAALVTAAKEHFPLVTSDQVNDAADPITLQPTHLPDGKYLNINRRYCGLDHSGPGQDAENDEIWVLAVIRKRRFLDVRREGCGGLAQLEAEVVAIAFRRRMGAEFVDDRSEVG